MKSVVQEGDLRQVVRKFAAAIRWRSATPLELAEQSVDSTDREEIVEVAQIRPPELVR